MKTIHWHVDNPVDKDKGYPQIEEAAAFLSQNEVVAFPTETVYGLGANAHSDEAVEKIYKAKGRPSDNPLIVHIGHQEDLWKLTNEIPDAARLLIKAYWPGPLTLIFKAKNHAVSPLVTAGLSTVAVRMPDHPVALSLLKKAGLPIAAPSANSSGKPSPTTAAHVTADLDGLIAGIVDGGSTGVGVESTVLDCTGEVPVILRPGGISREQIEKVIGPVDKDAAVENPHAVPKSPGMKYRHYSPEAPLVLTYGTREWRQSLIDEKRDAGLRVGVLATEESAACYEADKVVICGRRAEPETVARELYHSLRSFDEAGLDLILSETFPDEGVGEAVMNRLEKASDHHRIIQNLSGN